MNGLCHFKANVLIQLPRMLINDDFPALGSPIMATLTPLRSLSPLLLSFKWPSTSVFKLWT